jgi:hypothetical protein
MKTLRAVLAALAVLPLVVATPAQAQTQWSLVPHLGFNIDNDELYLGANARIQLPGAPVTLNPGFDWYPFIGSQNVDASLFVIDLDVLYHLQAKSVDPYLGGGLFWSRASRNAGGLGGSVSATDIGLNLKGGAVFRPLGKLRPFAEGVIAISNGSAFLLKGGFLFSMGR